MKVTCPECDFSSEIPEDKIPSTAQMATCPKCQAKFKFRNLDQDTAPLPEPNPEEIRHPDPEEEYGEAAAYVQQHAHEEISSDAQDPVSPAPYDDQFGQQPEYKLEDQPEEEKSDLWQRLDSMKPEGDIHEEEQDFGPESNGNEVPFENLEKYGFFPGFFLTIKQVILSPANFFKDMPLKGFLMPLFFFILLAEFQEICNFIWAMTGVDSSMGSDVGRIMNDSMIADSLKDGTGPALLSLLLYPLMLAGISFPLIGVTHILLMIFGAGEKGFQATFRATAYSYAPIILCVIPVVGDMIGALISMAISIIAYKNIHNTTYMRVVLSMVMPIVLLLVILGFYMQFNQPTI
ncbi:zinc-ribbon domain-containing protein [Maridesulfovibrio sp.]|uniref:zinc-ribbon domain-containing protein n=1 Tax=Maridesulfovibrio sp. TaxID=2795000 RepID=UPI002AA7F615|nr:zinc-ribbon domain-containing protein [Maridesulfovibrio sp.]